MNKAEEILLPILRRVLHHADLPAQPVPTTNLSDTQHTIALIRHMTPIIQDGLSETSAAAEKQLKSLAAAAAASVSESPHAEVQQGPASLQAITTAPSDNEASTTERTFRQAEGPQFDLPLSCLGGKEWRLTAELTGRIATFVVASAATETYLKELAPLLIICKNFKKGLEATKDLWTVMSSDSPLAFNEKVLRISAGRKLTIWGGVSAERKRKNAARAMQELERFQALALQQQHRWSSATWFLLPTAKKLELDLFSNQGPQHRVTVDLHYDRTTCYSLLTLALSNIVLSPATTPGAFGYLLSSCTHLQELSLVNFALPLPSGPDCAMVPMPSLESIKLVRVDPDTAITLIQAIEPARPFAKLTLHLDLAEETQAKILRTYLCYTLPRGLFDTHGGAKVEIALSTPDSLRFTLAPARTTNSHCWMDVKLSGVSVLQMMEWYAGKVHPQGSEINVNYGEGFYLGDEAEEVRLEEIAESLKPAAPKLVQQVHQAAPLAGKSEAKLRGWLADLMEEGYW